MKADKQASRTQELLKDRQDYRQALINRREEIDRKISRVEEQIRKLRQP